MFKRSTKITSLLVAAASVATMVPAMAADKIAEKDGTIYNAVSYKDGKLYIDGKDIEDAKDKDGVFFINDGKSTEVDSDIDSGDEITATYGEKYLEIEDGDYYLDLETGKVTDDEIRKDDQEDAASEVRKKIRKDDPSRYDEDVRDHVADVDVKDDAEIWEVPAAKFTKPYYQLGYLKKGDTNFTVYTDGNGKYIDADNDLGKINLITTDDTIKFEEVGSKKTSENDKLDKSEFKIEIIQGTSYTIGSDDKYVYRTVGLKIYECANPYYKDENGKVVEYKDNEKKFTTCDSVFVGSTKNPNLIKAEEYTIDPTGEQELGSYNGYRVVQRISK